MKKVCEIAQLGNPVLRQQAVQVEAFDSNGIIRIVRNMLHALSESSGVGLAAPQISELVRIVIIASRPTKRYPLAPEMEPVVMMNPNFEVISELMKTDWEGCLSIPGIRALVPRYEKIKISYYNQQGIKQELVADSFIARIFQHEYDHLNGLVYLDRVVSNKDIVSETEFQKLMDQ
ncbi:MAG: peptide deformylase [Methylococcaceae bacterium]|nr:peptide deformylase [Methylococcaceae bacterium]